MPGSVQHVEQKAVQDRPLAAGAVDHGFGWATNPANEAAHTHCTHTNKINSTGRALTEYLFSPSLSLPLSFSLSPLDSPEAPGSMCAEKPVDQVSPQISPCMRKKKSQRPKKQKQKKQQKQIKKIDRQEGTACRVPLLSEAKSRKNK